jgi:hypothetical protein
MKEIYLSKNGETFGPYTEETIETMRACGEFAQFNWIWDPPSNQWKPIERPSAPPPPPTSGQTGTAARRPEPRAAERSASPSTRLFHVPDEAASVLQALCYDQISVLSGLIRKAGENGCDFVAESRSAAPLFMKDMSVRLNLLDPRSGTTMSVNAQVVQAVRQNGQWSYRLAWGSCPELLLQAVA